MFLLLLFLLVCAPVAAAPYHSQERLVLDATLSGSLSVRGSAPTHVEAELSFAPFPTATQEILSKSYDPEPVRSDPLRFEWERPKTTIIPFRASYGIRSRRNMPEIREAIPFPLPPPSAALEPYTRPQEIIDITPKIAALAHQLTADSDDLASAVHAVAAWVVGNIVYNLTTANIQAVERASTVLEQRNGVCDELTSLFIAMLRSIGIPARFVSGIAYTNSPLFANPWGPHGWAEVHFPGIGWVPYDLTYEEFGWVDPTHIAMRYTIDAGSATLDYTWNGEDTVLEAQPLDISVRVAETIPAVPSIMLTAEPMYETVGFGSANRIVATVTNLRDHALSVPIILSQTDHLSTLDRRTQFALIPPNTVQQVSWLVEVPGDLAEGYTYTYPLAVHAFGQNASAEFTASARAPRISADSLPPPIATPFTFHPAPFTITCTPVKPTFAVTEESEITCMLTSDERTREFSVCLRDCQSLTVQETATLTLRIFEPPGSYTRTITARAGAMIAQSTVVFAVLDQPRLTIENITAPVSLSYADEAAVQFFIRKRSMANAYNATVAVRIPGFTDRRIIPVVDIDQQFTTTLRGSDLTVGENRIPITITWQDAAGNADTTAAEFSLTLTPPTFTQKFRMLLRDIARWAIRVIG